MTQIRVPRAADELIQFVRGQKKDTQEEIFDTFAHLVCFGACLGLERDEKDLHPEFLDRPGPIDVQVFKNNGLYEFLEVVVLASEGRHELLQDDNEGEFVKIVEGYASGGLRTLARLHGEFPSAFFLRTLTDVLNKVARDASER